MTALAKASRPVRVECVAFGINFDRPAPSLEVLVDRSKDVKSPAFVLPSSVLGNGETLERVAVQILKMRAGIRDIYLEQLYTFDSEREGSIAVSYYGLTNRSGKVPSTGSAWIDLNSQGGLQLVGRDMKVLAKALARLRAKVRYEPIGFSMLPERFTMPQLRGLYEAVLGHPIDDRNFSRRMLSMGILRRVSETKREKGEQGRPAVIYEFDDKAYERLAKKGWSFEI